jgi:hypothetical protein
MLMQNVHVDGNDLTTTTADNLFYVDHCLLFTQDAPMSRSVQGATSPLPAESEALENGSINGSATMDLDMEAGEKLPRRTPAPSKYVKQWVAEAAAEEDQTRINRLLAKIGISTKADLADLGTVFFEMMPTDERSPIVTLRLWQIMTTWGHMPERPTPSPGFGTLRSATERCFVGFRGSGIRDKQEGRRC